MDITDAHLSDSNCRVICNESFIALRSYCSCCIKFANRSASRLNVFFSSSLHLQLSPLNILPYQYPQAPSVGSLGHSTIGSAGLSPTQSISSTSSQSNVSSASPDVISSTPESPAIASLAGNNCTTSTNSVATSASSNNYSLHQHHQMEISSR